jgi:predicted nucleotidyltransferase
MKWGLKDAVVEELIHAFQGFPIEKVVLFGSRARGTNKATSDIDLAVFAPTMTHRQVSLLSNTLDEIDIIYRLDLVHVDEAVNPQLIHNIEKEGQLIYENKGDTKV